MLDFFQKLNIPKTCYLGNVVFKKQFYENGDLTSSDKKLFINKIEKIIWAYCLKPEIINIPIYRDTEREYVEVEFFEVILSSEKANTQRLAEIIMRSIPYPMFLVFKFNDRVQIYVAHQRNSHSDMTKNTIEEFIYTDWIFFDSLSENDRIFFERLNINKLGSSNFYQFYSDLVDKLVEYNASKLLTKYPDNVTTEELKYAIDKIAILDKQLVELYLMIKKESQFNKSFELDTQIKKIERDRANLIKSIS